MLTKLRKHWTITRLNNRGVQHFVTPIAAFVVLFGLIGMFLLVRSQAAPNTSNTSGGAAVTTATPTVYWIMDAHAISLLQGAGASSTLVGKAFTKTNTYTLNAVSGSPGIATATYKSYAQLAADFSKHVLPGTYKAILYDNEDWSYTPVNEQINPTLYEQEAATLVHKYKLTFITAPAADIVNSTGKLVSGGVYATYLSRNISGNAARYADVVDIQAQNDSETTPATYAAFVTSAAKAARAANRNIKVLAGLSTNPGGTALTGQQLYADYTAVRSVVDGVWLNIPGQSSLCPNCGTPQPQVGVYMLQQIYGIN